MIAEVAHHAPVEPVVDGDVMVSATVGPQGELVVLWCDPALLSVLSSRQRKPGSTKARRTHKVRVTAHHPDPVVLTEISDIDLDFPTAHPLPDGEVLLVGARVRGSAPNAVVYDSEGRVVRRADLGDGIEHVYTTAGGDVWVAYFDQGIFGRSEVAAHGLVRFGPDLRPVWRFPGWVIADCYALNVTEREAWTCYYTEFPVVRVRDGKVTRWDNDITGVRALAVVGRRVGLFGGYEEDRDRLVVGWLDGDRLRVTAHHRLTLPGGEQLPADAGVIGRGGELHVVTADAWYRLDLASLA
ncbi:hypothetical protein [Saccharothrix sp.]|uniref:hypothetical protein n=1 Tax=Saccharothrix sp. TaxID=1873460 RepID=UPI002811667D|nr:hypothetical protein [Saccharothrix sp.]